MWLGYSPVKNNLKDAIAKVQGFKVSAVKCRCRAEPTRHLFRGSTSRVSLAHVSALELLFSS